MINFDIHQMPPGRDEIESRLHERQKMLRKFNRNTALATTGELGLMGLAYVAAFNFFDLSDHFGVAIAVALIGPATALICVIIATSLRRRELLDKIHAYQPPEEADAASALKGRNRDVDTYLEKLQELGRDLTQVEFKKLTRHCKAYG